MAKVTWNADLALGPLWDALAAGLDRGGRHLVESIRRAVAQPFPPASAPGQPPHRRTGTYQASFDHAVDADHLKLYVGSDDPKAAGLELGTSRVAARPAIMPTLLAEADEIARQIGGAGES
jgi:hypothetical protein